MRMALYAFAISGNSTANFIVSSAPELLDVANPSLNFSTNLSSHKKL